MAAVSIANIVKTSLGPVGLDKMLVDEVGVCSLSLSLLLFFSLSLLLSRISLIVFFFSGNRQT
jgi:hypothetical protein